MRCLALQKNILFMAVLSALVFAGCDSGGGHSNVLYSDEIGDIVQTLTAIKTLTVPESPDVSFGADTPWEMSADRGVQLTGADNALIDRANAKITVNAGYMPAADGLSPRIMILVYTERGYFTEEHRARVGAALEPLWKNLAVINGAGGEAAYRYTGLEPETVIKTDNVLLVTLGLSVEHADLPWFREAWRGAVTVRGGAEAGAGDWTAAGHTLTMRTDSKLAFDLTIPAGLILETGANSLTTGGRLVTVHGTLRIASGGAVSVTGDGDDVDDDDDDENARSVWDFVSTSSSSGGRVEVISGGVLRLGETGTRGFGGAGFDYALGSNTLLVGFMGANRRIEQEFSCLNAGTGAALTVQHTPDTDFLVLDIKTTVRRGVTLTVAAGKTLQTNVALLVEDGAALSAAGRVLLESPGTVVFKAAETAGGRLLGNGFIEAGATEISGGASGWEASGSWGAQVSIGASGSASSITGGAWTSFAAVGAGARITQKPLPSNTLSIGADTTIALRGTAVEAGVLMLKGHADTPARLSFAGAGSLSSPPRLKTGYFDDGTVFEGAAIPGLSGTAAIFGAARSGDTGKLAGLAVTGAGQYLTALAADISLSSETAVNAP